MTERLAKQLMDFAEKAARTFFDQVGELRPLYHFIDSDGKHAIFTVPPYLDKNEYVELAKYILARENAAAYVFINEAWTVEARGDDADRVLREYKGSLEYAPGRREVVLLSAEDERGMIHGQLEIIRPKDRKPYLGPLQIYDYGAVEGRMVGLLPVKGSRH